MTPSEFVAIMRDLPTHLTEAIEEALPKAAEVIAEEARSLVNVPGEVSIPGEPPKFRTGELRDSIQVDHEGLQAVIGSELEYAKYLEMGTSTMEPRPFLTPAAMSKLDEAGDIIRDAVEEVIDAQRI